MMLFGGDRISVSLISVKKYSYIIYFTDHA